MNQTEVVLDGSALNHIATSTHTAKVVMNSLAERERLRSFSDITRTKTALMKTGNRIDDSEYMQFWKDLATAGVGSIIYGRKGKPDRFNWFYDLKAVARAAHENKDEQVSQLVTKPTKVKRTRRKRQYVSDENKKHVYDVIIQKILQLKLRPDFNMELKIPNDLTPEEVDKITSSLKQLTA